MKKYLMVAHWLFSISAWMMDKVLTYKAGARKWWSSAKGGDQSRTFGLLPRLRALFLFEKCSWLKHPDSFLLTFPVLFRSMTGSLPSTMALTIENVTFLAKSRTISLGLAVAEFIFEATQRDFLVFALNLQNQLNCALERESWPRPRGTSDNSCQAC